MKVYENGKYREMTAAEIAETQAAAEASEREYWMTTLYDDAVDAEIRKRYTVSQEFAILRQREEKPDEYDAYYAYCEECKAHVKAMVKRYAEELDT